MSKTEKNKKSTKEWWAYALIALGVILFFTFIINIALESNSTKPPHGVAEPAESITADQEETEAQNQEKTEVIQLVKQMVHVVGVLFAVSVFGPIILATVRKITRKK